MCGQIVHNYQAFLLVVEYDVWLPHFGKREPECLDATKVRVVPGEVDIIPNGRGPAVRGEDLILLVHVDNVMERHIKGHGDCLRRVGHS